MNPLDLFFNLRPRWAKVLSDLWDNKVRSLLVIASISVGLFAVGMITNLYGTLSEDLVRSYRATNPANILVSVSDFKKDEVDSIRNLPGVAEAEGVRKFSVRLRSGKDEWVRININAVPDIERMKLDRVSLLEGSWPPGNKEIVFDRHKLEDAHIHLGEDVEVMLSDGTLKRLHFGGIVRDETIGVGTAGGYFTAALQGYVDFETLDWLAQPDRVNFVLARVEEGGDDVNAIRPVTNRVVDKLENNRHSVLNQVSRASYDHPNKVYVDAMQATLFALGFLVVFLSAFLIINTLTALLNQQMEQIGVMKTIGARRLQVIGIYLTLILIYSGLALIISLALSGRAAYWMEGILGREVNFSPGPYRETALAVGFQFLIALIVPQAAGFVPILRGSMLSIQEAFNGTAPGRTEGKRTWVDFFITSLHLPRPLILSLRNTFRRKTRLALTLITLTLGGAIFIATFSVQSSMNTYIHSISKYFVADLNLTTDRLYRMEDIERVLYGLDDVDYVEGWSGARAEILLEGDKVGESVNLLGPPPESRLITPTLLEGRWIMPGDENAIVLNETFRTHYPNLKVGDTLELRVDNEKQEWKIVGFFQFAGKPAGYLAYTNYDYLAKIIHQPGKAYSFHIVSKRPLATIEEQRALGSEVETYLKKLGYQVNDISPGYTLVQSATSGLNTLVFFLVIMALLAALVGSIGLTGTLSMNVMERTREIGLLRAIGASNRAVMQLVIVEGMLIGFISWILGSLAAFPISRGLWAVVSMSLFGTSTNFTLSPAGFVYWVGLVLLLTLLASLGPAFNAARLTIREALSYE